MSLRTALFIFPTLMLVKLAFGIDENKKTISSTYAYAIYGASHRAANSIRHISIRACLSVCL